MKTWKAWIIAVVLVPGLARAEVDLTPYIKQDVFGEIKISPTGEYFAATVPFEDRTALAVIRRSDMKVSASIGMAKNQHVNGFWWVNSGRIVASLAEKYGQLEAPLPTGELFAINANGGRTELLVGYRVEEKQGTHIKTKKAESVGAYMVDILPNDEKNVVVAIWPMGNEPYTRAEKMDVYSGRRTVMARAPVQRADFVTDNQGVVRFAHGAGADNVNKLYYRDGNGAEWKLINDEAVSERIELPLGFSEDGSTAYLLMEQTQGPDAIVALDVATAARREVMRDGEVDPYRIVYRNGTSIPVGAIMMEGRARSGFFDPQSPDARQYRSLEAVFPGESVYITSSTSDGRLALVQVDSGRNPGDFYLYEPEKNRVQHVLSRRDWFDPAQMAEVRPVRVTVRDGRTVHGYLTVPAGKDARRLPMVVMPHGGPFGIFDTWEFDTEVQLLAKGGYAVLQVNYRGSGNYGREFKQAGAREWGGKMQDDVTDATRWAIREGIADAGRICIYGNSYGGYAALMGVVREPQLYRCAVGYVGVYDLPMMYTTGDIQQRVSGETYLREWLGERDTLATVSPTYLADRIKAPVFLAAGGEDKRAPIAHSQKMEAALRKAGVPVETLYYKTEGHGFHTEPHRREYYAKLLGFLDRHIGTAAAAATQVGDD